MLILQSLEERDLTGFGQVAKGSRLFQHLDMSLGHLGAGCSNLFNGDELLSFSALHQTQCRIFAQAGNRHKGRAQLTILDEKFRCMTLIDVDGQEFQSPEVELVNDL